MGKKKGTGTDSREEAKRRDDPVARGNASSRGSRGKGAAGDRGADSGDHPRPQPKVSKTEPDGTIGRPTFCTPELTARIVANIDTGAYLPQCCEVAGVGYSTIKEWMAKGRKGQQPYAYFTATIRHALKDRELRFVRIIADASVKDAKAAQWMLTHRYSKRWADREKVEAEIAHSGELRFINLPRKKPV